MATKAEINAVIRLQDEFSRHAKNIHGQMTRMEAQIKKNRLGFATMATAVAAGGAALRLAGAAFREVGDFLSGTVRASSEFNEAMTRSTAIMGELSGKMRTEMAGAAEEVSRTATFSAKEAAEAYFFLASAGLDAAQSIGALPQVAQFAQAGAFDLSQATDLLTDAQSALGLTVKDTGENMRNMGRVSDVLVRANTLANASVEQFSQSLTTKAGAALKIVNKDVEEGVAVLAAFADQGVKGADAGTALNIVLRDLQTKALNNAEAFEAAGVAVYDSSGNMRNIAEIIADLEGALDGMSDSQKKATLLQMGFSDKSVIFIQTLLGMSDKIRGYESELRKAGGTTKEVADKQLTAFNARAKLTGQAWENLQRVAGDFVTQSGAVAEILNAARLAFQTLERSLKVNRDAWVKLVSGGIVFVLDSFESLLQTFGFTMTSLGKLGELIVAVQSFFLDLYDVILNNPISRVLIPNFTALGKGLRTFVEKARDVVAVNRAMAGAMVTGGEDALKLAAHVGTLVEKVNRATAEQLSYNEAQDKVAASVAGTTEEQLEQIQATKDQIEAIRNANDVLEKNEEVVRELAARYDVWTEAILHSTPEVQDLNTVLDASFGRFNNLASVVPQVRREVDSFREHSEEAGLSVSDAFRDMSRTIGGVVGDIGGQMDKLISDVQRTQNMTTSSTLAMGVAWINLGVTWGYVVAQMILSLRNGLIPSLQDTILEMIRMYNATEDTIEIIDSFPWDAFYAAQAWEKQAPGGKNKPTTPRPPSDFPPPAAQHGGYFPANPPYGTLVRLAETEGEFVIPKSKMGGQGGRDALVAVPIHVMLDGRVIEKKIVRTVARAQRVGDLDLAGDFVDPRA